MALAAIEPAHEQHGRVGNGLDACIRYDDAGLPRNIQGDGLLVL